MAVLLQTSLGEITIDLFIDEVPVLAANFLKLCKLKRYNNSIFHSVEKNFIARAGVPWLSNTEPNSKDPGQSILSILCQSNPSAFQSVLSKQSDSNSVFDQNCCDSNTGQLREFFHPRLRHNKRGIVAMANDKTNQIGSTFYITLRDSIDYLDDRRSIIGYVAEGNQILDQLNNVLVEDRISNKPLRPIRIFHTIILDDPFVDPPGMSDIPDSPVVIEDSVIEEGEGTIEDEIQALEKIAKSEAKSRAIALEILGDLPDAELAPPDNVLFVCKLNPITETEDLELIFSRFGHILSCEIIRDWKTGDSLQYGFIEFEDKVSCENALFKMEGCLIDDRRIHVDFCQSVAKQWYAFKRHGARQKKEEVEPLEVTTAAHRRHESRNIKHKQYGFVFEESDSRKTRRRNQSQHSDEKKNDYRRDKRSRSPIRSHVHEKEKKTEGRRNVPFSRSNSRDNGYYRRSNRNPKDYENRPYIHRD